MKMKNETDNLNETIDYLRIKQETDLKQLTEQFYDTYESLKPINLINSTLEEVSRSPEIKQNALKGLLGLAISYFAKKIIFGTSQKLLRKNMPMLLQMTAAIVVLKNSDKIVVGAENILQYIFQYRDKSE